VGAFGSCSSSAVLGADGQAPRSYHVNPTLGQTVFTLPDTPDSIAPLWVVINTLKYSLNAGFLSVLTNQVTWLGPFTLQPTWDVEFFYFLPITGVPASGSGFTEALEASFLFNTPSPLVFGTLNPGDLIINSEIEITTPFNDPASILQASLVSGPILINAGENDPTTNGTYGAERNTDITLPDQASLTIIPGASTQGAGRIILNVRRN